VAIFRWFVIQKFFSLFFPSGVIVINFVPQTKAEEKIA
jgi:hypothetical protein